MPFSSNTFDDILKDHIGRLAPINLLDVGAGAGKNGALIKQVNQNIFLEGIEPTQEYIDKYNLNTYYNKLYQKDLQTFAKDHSTNKYDIVIFGDVLEHLLRSEVIDYIDYFAYRANWIIAIWPTNLPQDNVGGNHFEIHKNNFTLNDLVSKFNIVYYVSNFGGWHGEYKIEPCTFHYCVIKGYFANKEKHIYNWINFKR
jgi:hypothetical protein